jgi:hypothetical protein
MTEDKEEIDTRTKAPELHELGDLRPNDNRKLDGVHLGTPNTFQINHLSPATDVLPSIRSPCPPLDETEVSISSAPTDNMDYSAGGPSEKIPSQDESDEKTDTASFIASSTTHRDLALSSSRTSTSHESVSYSGESNGSIYNELCNEVDSLEINQALLTEPILDRTKNELVDRIMEDFWRMFNDRWPADVRQNTGNSCQGSNSGRSSTVDGNNDGSSITSGRSFKRRRIDEEGKSNDKSNDDGQGHQSPDHCTTDIEPNAGLRFACPFRKHDSRKYDIYFHRGICAVSYWGTIARVKYESIFILVRHAVANWK